MAMSLGEKSAERREAEPDVTRRDLIALLGALAGGSVLAGCNSTGETGNASPGGESQQGLTFIDGSNPPVDYHRIEDAAASNAGGPPVTLIVDKPLTITDATVEIPSNVTLRFQDNGQLIVPADKKVYLSGPIVAPASPNHPLFKVGGFGASGTEVGGTVIPNNAGTRYYANWWSDDSGKAGAYGEMNEADLGQQWNAMVREVVRLGAGVRARSFAVAGRRKVSTMLDIREFQAGQHCDFAEAALLVQMSQGVAVNFTDSMYLRVSRLLVQSIGTVSSSEGPHAGVLLARPAPPSGNEGSIVFEDLRILGLWRIAGLYNAASPNNVFIGGLIENFHPSTSVGRYAAFFGRHVVAEDVGLLAGYPEGGKRPPEAPHAGTLRGQSLIGVRLNGNVSVATLCIRGFHNVSVRSPNTFSGNSSQSHIVIDASDDAVGGIAIDHLYAEGTASAGLKLVTSNLANRIGHVSLTTRRVEATASVVIDAQFVDDCTFRVRSGLPVSCSANLRLTDSRIEIIDDQSPTPIALGHTFSGRITTSSIGSITGPTNTMQAEISSMGGTPRTRYAVPVSLMAQDCPAGALDTGEVILWLDKASGDIRARTGPTCNDFVTLADWDSLPPC
jgi:hypothetical protein